MGFFSDVGGFFENVGKTYVAASAGSLAGLFTGGPAGMTAGTLAGLGHGLANWNKGSYGWDDAAKAGGIFGGGSGLAVGSAKAAGLTLPSLMQLKNGAGGVLVDAAKAAKNVKLPENGLAGLLVGGISSLFKGASAQLPSDLPAQAKDAAGGVLNVLNPSGGEAAAGSPQPAAQQAAFPIWALLALAGAALYMMFSKPRK